jgi:hypothetical protein
MPATTVSLFSFGQVAFKVRPVFSLFCLCLFRIVKRAVVLVESEKPPFSTFRVRESFRRQGLFVI